MCYYIPYYIDKLNLIGKRGTVYTITHYIGDTIS
jgi:hypothetical protein